MLFQPAMHRRIDFTLAIQQYMTAVMVSHDDRPAYLLLGESF